MIFYHLDNFRCSVNQLEVLSTTLEPLLHRDYKSISLRRYPSAPFRNSNSNTNNKNKKPSKKRSESKPVMKQSSESHNAIAITNCNGEHEFLGTLDMNTSNFCNKAAASENEMSLAGEITAEKLPTLQNELLISNSIVESEFGITCADNKNVKEVASQVPFNITAGKAYVLDLELDIRNADERVKIDDINLSCRSQYYKDETRSASSEDRAQIERDTKSAVSEAKSNFSKTSSKFLCGNLEFESDKQGQYVREKTHSSRFRHSAFNVSIATGITEDFFDKEKLAILGELAKL